MSDYDPLATIYDADLGTKTDDIPMYLKYAHQQGSPILELACGTGRLLLPLAEQGFDLYGIDASQAMLEVARNKIDAARHRINGKIVIGHGQMRQVADNPLVRGLKFNLVIIAFNAFLHLLTQRDQEKTLTGIHNLLAENGLLVVDIFAPHHHVLAQVEDTRIHQHVRHDENTGETYIRSDRVRRNLAEQTQEVDFIYDVVRADGGIERKVYTVHSRFVFRYEMALLLEMTGYEVIALYGGYDGQHYDYHSGIMVFVVKKATKAAQNRLYL